MKWKDKATADLDQVRRWWRRWPDSIVGLPTGEANGIAVLDIDAKDGKDGFVELEARGLADVARSPVFAQTRSGGEHHFFAYHNGLRNSASKIAKGVDVRGEGGYVNVWDGGVALLRGDLVGLPDWPEGLRPPPRPEAKPTDSIGVTLDEARELLDRLDLDEWCEERDGWLKVGMALHAEFGDEGRELWDEFSAESHKFDEAEQEKAWAGFGRREQGGVTMRTIIKAAGGLRADVNGLDYLDDLPDEPAPKKARADEPDDSPPQERLNKKHGLVLAGGDALVVSDAGETVEFYNRTALATWYANRKLPSVTPTGQPTEKPVSEVWLGSRKRRSYEGLEFHPGHAPSGPHDGPGLQKGPYNLWRGWAVEPDPSASCELFLRHTHEVICAGDDAVYDWVIRWLAHMVQKPQEKPGTSLILKGRKGAGKDLFAVYLGKLCPQHYVPVALPKHVTGNFNNHMASCLILHIEEGVWSGDRQAEQILKHIITAPTITIEKKGIDAVPVRSCFRVIESSNEEWTVPASAGERRFCVLAVANHRMQDPTWFDPLVDEMRGGGPAALLHLLQNIDLTGFNVRKPPLTEALFEEQKQSLRGVAWWWNRVLTDGEMPRGVLDDEKGWPGEADLDALYDDYAESLSRARYKGDVKSKIQFSRELGEFGLESRRRGGGGRDRVFTVPGLARCRKIFRESLK